MKPTARLSCQTATLALGLAFSIALPASAGAADVLLSGAVKSASGEPMSGVTVSAKAGTITTTVFSDAAGNYYFPPLPSGKYRVWVQALSFATAQSDVDLPASRQQDFTLRPITDFEQQVRQLPGDLILAGLPEDTPDDKRVDPSIDPKHVRHYEFVNDNELKTTVVNADGKTTASATWKRQS